VKAATNNDRTHNPSDEAYWVSRLRENFTSGSYGEGLETGRASAQVPRQSFTRQTAFQELTLHLNSEINALGYPRAALFGFCVALVAYIIMAVLKAALRSVHGAQNIEENFSGYYLADELSGLYRGMMVTIPASNWIVFSRLTQAELIELLRALAENVNLSRFQKHRRGPKKAAKKRKTDKRTPHVSTARVIGSRKR